MAAKRGILTHSTGIHAGRGRDRAWPCLPIWRMLAVGTETDGSVVCPASMNGIVGVKPTLGLICAFGHYTDCARVRTRQDRWRAVRDAALLLGVLAGVDARDG